MMKTIKYEFKNDNDKLIMLGMFVCSIFAVFLPSLIVILALKEQISEPSYQAAKALFNFEILLFLIGLLFLIPVIGWILAPLLSPLMIIFNVIILVINICAIGKGTEAKIPVGYEFL